MQTTGNLRLERATPVSQGVSPRSLLELVERLDKQHCHTLMVTRHNKVVMEGYWSPYRPEFEHMQYSVSKTLVSIAVGFAVQDGLLTVDTRLLDLFPDVLTGEPCENMRHVKVKHLLSMSNGVKKERKIFSNGYEPFQETWLYYALSEYVDYEPGTVFCYNNPNVFLLSAIIQKITGMKLIDYLRVKLLDPLGCSSNIWWEETPEGINSGLNGFNATPEDMTKISLFLLNRGEFNGKRLLNAEWIDAASSVQIENRTDQPGRSPDSQQGYGYLIWRCTPEGSYSANGMYGQFVVVLPKQDMTVVITSGCPHATEEWPDVDNQMILPAIWETVLTTLDAPSQDDVTWQAALDARLSTLTVYDLNGAATSPLAARESGRTWKMCDNELGIESVQLSFDKEPKVVLNTQFGPLPVTVGFDKWVDNDAGHDLGGFLCDDRIFFRYVSSRGAWTSENTFEFVLAFNRTTYVDKVRITFLGSAVKLQYDRIVWSYAKAAPGKFHYALIGLEA